MTQRDLANKLGAAQSRVVALIDSLERKGLATRTRSARDRRAQQFALTEDGTALLLRLRKVAKSQEAAITNGLTRQQKTDLYNVLSRLTALRGLDADVHPGYRRS